MPEARPAAAPGAAELRDQALAAMLNGRLAEAEDLLDQAVAADPRDAEAWNALGVVLLRRGMADRGIDALRRAVAAAPRFALAHRNLAVALDRRGEHALAARHYRAFVEHAPAGDRARDDARRRLAEIGAAEAAR